MCSCARLTNPFSMGYPFGRRLALAGSERNGRMTLRIQKSEELWMGRFRTHRSDPSGPDTGTAGALEVRTSGSPGRAGPERSEAGGPGCRALSGKEPGRGRDTQARLCIHPGVDFTRAERDATRANGKAATVAGRRDKYVDSSTSVTAAVGNSVLSRVLRLLQ